MTASWLHAITSSIRNFEWITLVSLLTLVYFLKAFVFFLTTSCGCDSCRIRTEFLVLHIHRVSLCNPLPPGCLSLQLLLFLIVPLMRWRILFMRRLSTNSALVTTLVCDDLSIFPPTFACAVHFVTLQLGSPQISEEHFINLTLCNSPFVWPCRSC